MAIQPSQQDRAQLIPLNFAAPGFKGLNTEMAGNILPPEWATKLENAVFDETGRPAARNGWLSITSTPVTGTIQRIHEYVTSTGTSEIIFSTADNIYDGVSAPASVKGALTISNGNIKFVNFNNKVIAFGIGTSNNPAVYSGSTFASIVVNSGTAPTGRIGTAAFGRIWVTDSNGSTIRYSALLDETNWGTAEGGGTIDMHNIWPAGQDEIVAITEFQGDLVVFGKNQTVIMTDGRGQALGISPDALYVSDTIPGVGAVSQFAITKAAGDLWVLTRFGVISLGRELQQKSTPFQNISKNVQSGVTGAYQGEPVKDAITMLFSPTHSMVVVIFPVTEVAFTFDTRAPLEDGSFRSTSWVVPLQTAAYLINTSAIYGSIKTTAGELHSYTGKSDSGTDFIFDYESGWLDLGQEMNVHLKFVKRMTSFVFVTQNVQVRHRVLYDFASNAYALNKIAQGSIVGEYNAWNAVVEGSVQAEYGTGADFEYGGGVTLRTMDAPLGGGGQYIKVGLRLNTEAGDFVLQQINLYARVGRLAT